MKRRFEPDVYIMLLLKTGEKCCKAKNHWSLLLLISLIISLKALDFEEQKKFLQATGLEL